MTDENVYVVECLLLSEDMWVGLICECGSKNETVNI